MKKLILPAVVLLAASLFAQSGEQVGTSPGAGVRYATDAYPGFDSEKDSISPSRKDPKWFAFINGPNRETPAEQYAYCEELLAEGNYSKAAKHFDALVREWPTSPEAPRAQLAFAKILEEQEKDYAEALSEYRYLMDFFSISCDYDAIADKLYELCQLMREEGKTILFFRFRNTVDVRRAYESAVLRAPGAKWVPTALLTIGGLREEEGKDIEAVKVYENLRNVYAQAPEAKIALVREAEARLRILDDHAYNRERCRDTIAFLKQAETTCDAKDFETIRNCRTAAEAQMEEAAYRATCFYDSKMRTKRSAINAYERFLKEYPDSAHADEVRARLDELKEKEPGK